MAILRICDRCGSDDTVSTDALDPSIVGRLERMDLCNRCIQSLVKWINGLATISTDEQSAQAAK